MTTPTYALKGITNGRGACDHCGRSLARLFRVVSSDGAEMVVGRTCAKNMTGYDWTVAHAERLERIAQRDAAAEVTYGDLYRALKAQAVLTAGRYGTAGTAGEGLYALRDNGAEAFARDMLAQSIAREGEA